MSRIRFPSGDELTPDQKAVYDEVVYGPRGRLVGPLRAVIHSPDLAARWSRFGEFLRFSTCIPKRLNELAIIVVGRHWNSQLEFQICSLSFQQPHFRKKYLGLRDWKVKVRNIEKGLGLFMYVMTL